MLQWLQSPVTILQTAWVMNALRCLPEIPETTPR
jgi:hypothetical protein